MANDLLLNILIKAQNQATPAFNAVSNALSKVNDTTLLSAQAALKLDGANANLAAAQAKVAIASDQAVIAIQKYQVMSTDASVSNEKLTLAADQAALAMAKIDQASVAAAAAQAKVAQAASTTGTAEEKAALGAKTLESAEAGLGSEGRMLTGVIEGISGALDMIGGMIAISAISSLIGQFQNASQAALGSSASMEQMTVAMKTLLPVGDQATQMMSKLYSFAAKTPFQFPDIDAAAQKLIAFGYSAKATIPILTGVGDALGALGKSSPAELQGVVDIFGKIQSQGKLTTIAMKELAIRGINSWKLLADQMHVTVPVLQQMVSKGVVPADKAVRGLLTGMEKKFGGGMAKQAQTFNGLMTTIKDNAATAWRSFSGPLFDKAKEALVTVGDIIASPKFQQTAKDLGKQLAAGMAQAAPIVKELGKVVGDLAQEIRPYLVQLQAWIVKNHVVQIVVAMVVLTIRGLGAVLKFLIPIIAGIIVAVAKFVGTIVARLQPTLQKLQAFWKAHWLQIQAIVFGVWNMILGIIKYAWSLISGIFLIFIDILTGNWKGLWTDLKNMLGGMWDGIVQAVGGGLQALVNTLILYADPIFSALVKPFFDAYNQILVLMGKTPVAIPTLSGLIGPVNFIAPTTGGTADGSAVSKKKAGKTAKDPAWSLPSSLSSDPTASGAAGGTGKGRGGASQSQHHRHHTTQHLHKIHSTLHGLHQTVQKYSAWRKSQGNNVTKRGTLIIDEPDGSKLAISGTWDSNGKFSGNVFQSGIAAAQQATTAAAGRAITAAHHAAAKHHATHQHASGSQSKLSGTHHTAVHHHHVTNHFTTTVHAHHANAHEVYKQVHEKLSKELRRSGNYASGTSKAA